MCAGGARTVNDPGWGISTALGLAFRVVGLLVGLPWFLGYHDDAHRSGLDASSLRRGAGKAWK